MEGKHKIALLISGMMILIAVALLAYNRLSAGLRAPNLAAADPGAAASTDNGDRPAIDDSDGEVEDAAQEYTPAIDVTVYDGNGEAVLLSERYGKPLVLNFWASWCPPCKQEMPEFNEVWLEIGDEVEFMMVDLVDGSRETVDAGRAYVEQQGFEFPVYYDSDGEASARYAVYSIPTTYFIDRNGYVAAVAQGMIDEETLRLGISMAEESGDATDG